MGKKRKDYAEFRFYEKPSKEPVLALTGESWIRSFGEEIDYLHFHNMVEVGFCYWGKGEMILNKNSFNYSDGTFTFIPHNYLHTTNSEKVCRWSYFFFDVEELLMDYYKDNPGKGKNVLQSVSNNAHVSTIEENHYMGELIQMIFEQMQQKKSYYKETIRGLLLSLVMQIASRNDVFSEQSENKIARESGKILAALDYISYHYREDIRISELAECCHLSETPFRRIFHRDMNMTPVEYVNLSRVQAACDLMRKGDSQMKDVAMKVGYQTMSTFNRNFRRIIGTSPYQWKKEVDKEIEKIENYHISAQKGW